MSGHGRRIRVRAVVVMVTVAAAWAAAAAFAATDAGQGAPGGASGIAYTTFFQDPAAGSDFSLEQHAIDLINATPAGERITFAFRDFNRDPVADALIAAQGRGVVVDGVVDGGERTRAVVQRLKTALGSDRFVICGEPTFEFNSCIANSPRFKPSLQHNKFLTFSQLSDGRQDVVLQTSENFLSPTQFNYYNDMVEITGDHALHAAYVKYVFDMKAQLRSDDRSEPLSGDGQHNTMFPSPRSQPDWDTNDTIVDRMDEIDCSEGGSASGRGLIRVANMAFRSERAVIMRKLIELRNAGCDIDVVASNADGDIVSGLVSAGVPLHLFAKRQGATPAVLVHDKFWLVDAKSTVTGRRTKITYAGSSNWRGDEQYSDDMLLRIVDDGVYAAYSDYWKLIKSRVVSDPSRSTKDTVAPRSALTVTPAANAAGWNRSEVTVRIAASDGHNVSESGLKRLHVETSGAQTGVWDFPGETKGYNVHELPITAEGDTTVTFYAEDNVGNLEQSRSQVVRIDKTPPTITGLPSACELWPPNNQLVHVADVLARDGLSGLGADALVVTASSNDLSDAGDIVISGGSVALRAAKTKQGATRVYGVRATATDEAGNATIASATCLVPHSQGQSTK